jgi:acyl-CoA thioester hydrolase
MLDALPPGHPLPVTTLTVEPARANALGHLAAAQYIVLFEQAFLAFVSGVGLTDGALRHGTTTPVLKDLHACYLREVRPGAVLAMDCQLLSFEGPRLRLFLTMRLADGTRAATCELAIVNLDLAAGRPADWSPTQRTILDRIWAAHKTAPVPAEAGRAAGPRSS